jgi:enediyne biosynthesis protein E4
VTRFPRRRFALIAGAAVAAIAVVTTGSLIRGLGSQTPTTPLGPAHYVEETASAGLHHVYDGPFEYFTGGGIAVYDCDDDGRPDIYVAGGAHTATLYHNDSPIGGALRFSPIHAASTDLAGVTGAYPIDIDGDGRIDLVVLRVGGNELLRGLGGCRFEDANASWGFDGGHAATMAFAATWEGSAALPTLAFGNYVDPAATDPSHLCYPNVLDRPAADGQGYSPPLQLTPSYCALSVLFSDWDRSGRRDLRVSNDDHYYVDGEDQLWRMDPGTAPRLYTSDEGWVPLNIEGMGIASFDLTGDGYPEVFLTTQGANLLQTLTSGPGQPTYRDIGTKRKVNATRPFTGGDPLPSTAWHPEFEDVNNDGFMDLFISKGNVRQQEDYALKDPSNLLLGQADGTFTESADVAGILSFDLGRGAALADFNLDGLLDLVEINLGSPVRLWRNVGTGTSAAPVQMGSWLSLRLGQPDPNRDAIGAWIEVRIGDHVDRREVVIGGGHASGQLGWIHFGLGPATAANVRVTWPDGSQGPWQQVSANQFLDIARDAAAPVPWTPPVSSVPTP